MMRNADKRAVAGTVVLSLALVVLVAGRAASEGGASLQGDDEAALAVVQGFLDALSARDGEAATALVLPEGRLFAVREGSDGTPGGVRVSTFEDLVGAWSEPGEEVWLERIWDPEVRVYGAVATVAAPYDFHRDGTFSHCGVDVFDLVKTDEGWKISGVVYTVRREGCTGPPAERR